MKKTAGIAALLALALALLLMQSACAEPSAAAGKETDDEYDVEVPAPAEGAYRLEQVVALSRHNIRAPLSGSGSVVAELTPHTWTEWTAPESELTLKGGVAETLMGQYFRKWLEAEELIPENWIPGPGEVRFYANARQRTIATARYFAAGMLPLADVDVEYKDRELGAYDPVFKIVYTYMSDAYRDAVLAQLDEQLGLWSDGVARRRLAKDYALLADVIDFDQSHGFQTGEYAAWVPDDIEVVLEKGKELSVKGSLKTAQTVGDALMLQYYEMDDPEAAAFGSALSDDDWERIADVNTTYQAIRFSAPLTGVNAAHPMLQEILGELENPERKFSFLCGHDSNIATVLSALGAGDYRLPDTIEAKTPIGVMLLFEKRRAEDGGAFARVRLVYQSTDQLRNLTPLSLDEPPVSFEVQLPGVAMSADGFYRLDDVYACLRDAIDAYDDLTATYGDAVADAA